MFLMLHGLERLVLEVGQAGLRGPGRAGLVQQLHVLAHGLLLGHALHRVPRIPLGARLKLHRPRLRALDVT